MGADLLIANLWAKNPPQLDFAAGKRAAETLSAAAIDRLRGQLPYLDDEDDAAVRDCAIARVETLREHFTGGFTRDLDSFQSPDGRWTCWVTGGLSWGDDPSELWGAVNDLSAVPEVLAAIGFEVDDDPPCGSTDTTTGMPCGWPAGHSGGHQ